MNANQKLINIKDGDSIAAVAKVIHEKDDEEQEIESSESENTNLEPVSYTHLTLPTICSV